MRHLDDGTLRRLIDEPLAVSSASQRHFEHCAECTARGESIRTQAQHVAHLMLVDPDAVAAQDALARFVDRSLTADRPRESPSLRERFVDFYVWRGRRFVAPIVAATAAVAALLLLAFTPVGSVAQSFLTIFEPRQFVAIDVSKGELNYLPDLQSFGTMVQRGEPAHREVSTPAQAAALSGLAVRLPAWIPPSVPRAVHYGVVSRASASFIFSAAKARAYAAAARRPMPAMPPGLDGSVLTLQVGPMVIIGFGKVPQSVRAPAHARGGDDDMENIPPLVIVQSVAPHVSSSGATARQIEAYLLQMPGVAPQLADEIRAIGDPSTTMPIPVPIDKAYSQQVTIDGTNGLAVGDNTGVGGMVVWQKNGIVYGVGGALPQRELMEVAQSLR